MLIKIATDHGNYANRKRKYGEVQKNGPQSFKCSEFHHNLCEELKKGFHGSDALHEREMLVANLMCVHYMPNRSAIDSQSSNNRPVDPDRLVWHP